MSGSPYSLADDLSIVGKTLFFDEQIFIYAEYTDSYQTRRARRRSILHPLFLQQTHVLLLYHFSFCFVETSHGTVLI